MRKPLLVLLIVASLPSCATITRGTEGHRRKELEPFSVRGMGGAELNQLPTIPPSSLRTIMMVERGLLVPPSGKFDWVPSAPGCWTPMKIVR